MPTISVKKRHLASVFGNLSDDEVDHLLFRFGLELEEIANEPSGEDGSPDEVVYKVEIPANRCDLLSTEGLLMALQTFFKSKSPPKFVTHTPTQPVSISVDPSVTNVRPYIVAAVLRNLTLTRDALESLIDFQEKLHHSVCRRRVLVAIGIHDLDTLKMPFLYTTKPPGDIRFRALNQTKIYSAEQLMQIYRTDLNLRQYLHIIEGAPRYPIIYDASGVVLSMPPIINGDHSKVTMDTKNLLIECTATDLNRAETVLDVLVCTFSRYAKPAFTVEAVSVNFPSGPSKMYPTLSTREMRLSVTDINRLIGVHLNAGEVVCFLQRMGLGVVSEDNDGHVVVAVPANRRDILHNCDLIEDIAIAYGYGKIPENLPPVLTIGKQLHLNKMTEKMRWEMAAAGFTEALTFTLCAEDDLTVRLNRTDGLQRAIHIANPKTQEFQVVRTSLLPGILKTIHHNRKCALPIRLFEIQDVALKTPDGRSAVNCRHICAVFYGKTSGFEIIHGLLDHLMALLSIPYDATKSDGYWIEEFQDDTYFPGRCASIRLSPFEEPIGKMGVLQPSVVKAFGLNLVCSCLETNFEQLLSAARCP